MPATCLPEADLDLLALYRDHGDADAFAEIVRRYAPAVFTTAMRVLNDRGRADDVSQETFFRLSQKPESVTQSLGGWLHTAATRLAIDAARSESSRAAREAAYEPAPPSEVTRWADLSPHVDRALADLPEDLRALLVRHFIMGKTQCQLAAEAGASPATVCRRIKQGVDALRARLKARGVVVAAALLATLLREHGAQAAAIGSNLACELGKITMLSGGKPLTLAPGGAALLPAGGWAWTSLVVTLALAFGTLVWRAGASVAGPAAKPAPTHELAHDARH